MNRPKQITLAAEAAGGFERHRKATRRDIFLAEMDKAVPWDRLCAVVEPHYPKTPKRGGRQPIGLERMLRIHLLQQWYALSDPAAEEALYDSQAMRRFVGIDLGREGVPDETTICKFRHLLENHPLAQPLFDEITAYLGEHGMKLSKGTIVDATIIHAAPSTKNKQHQRDPEMHQTRKGNQWYFGMKAHIGVDARTGQVHTVTTTAANVGDVTQIGHLLHGKEDAVYGDSGYRGAEKRVGARRGRRFYIAEQRSKVKIIQDAKLRKLAERIEHLKASTRSKVEHPFRVIKRQFGYRKARYRGLTKNHGQVVTLFAMANLWMARRRLLAAG